MATRKDKVEEDFFRNKELAVKAAKDARKKGYNARVSKWHDLWRVASTPRKKKR